MKSSFRIKPGPEGAWKMTIRRSVSLFRSSTPSFDFFALDGSLTRSLDYSSAPLSLEAREFILLLQLPFFLPFCRDLSPRCQAGDSLCGVPQLASLKPGAPHPWRHFLSF